MRSIWILMLGFFLMLNQSCGGSDEQKISDVGADKLRAFAVAAQSQYAESATEIPSALWPAGLSDAGCKAVRYYIDGIMIVLSEDARLIKGIFVGWNDDAPFSGSGIEFIPQADRIYTFIEKRRESRKTP